ncbi:hypothetical protein CD58_18240 [Sporocytophaga myxococcoides]|uniref:Uncharacterized protein n=1 Tax=Sporocytophaga myxococcoides TaxID=153721 RepID=A0A098LCY4_9BACT|nr:hypothetical protein [Sporocytophaga myxococcoides]GAL84252.1 hypothetical protein CD58_18240 [Sporocytophaga myxococcoides]
MNTLFSTSIFKKDIRSIFRELGKSKFAKILIQIFKEFSIPVILSYIVLIYYPNTESTKQSSVSNAERYFAYLFFISWFTGNLNRIIKQKKTEKSFEDLKVKTEDLIKQLEEASINTIGHLTGGDSYPQITLLACLNAEKNGDMLKPFFYISSNGVFPIYNLKIMITCYSPHGTIVFDQVQEIDILHQNNQYSIDGVLPFYPEDGVKMITYIVTRNALFFQKNRIDIVDGNSVVATKIFKLIKKDEYSVLYKYIDPSYNGMSDEQIFGTGQFDFSYCQKI